MAKKDMKSGGTCAICHSSPCKCMGGGWCMVLCGLLVAVGGLLLIWPLGWFTAWRVVGLLLLLKGLFLLWGGFKGH